MAPYQCITEYPTVTKCTIIIMIVLKILILFLPLLILVEANFKNGPFHRSQRIWIPQYIPTDSTSSSVDERELKISFQPTSKHVNTDADRHSDNDHYHGALIPSSSRVPLTFSTNSSVEERTSPSVQVRPDNTDATKKSVSVLKITTEHPVDIQTSEPASAYLPQPEYTDNGRPYHVPKPASRPWSPPKLPKLQSTELSKVKESQPITVRPASIIYRTRSPITSVPTEKSVPTESTTSPPITSMGSAVEIQTPEPPQLNELLPVNADKRPQNTRPSYINKPASSPWSPPKFASIPSVASSMERSSQPINVRPTSSVYQTPAPVIPVFTEKSVPTESTTSPLITSTDSAVKITPEPPQSNKLLPVYADNRPQDTRSSNINKPASSRWNPPKFASLPSVASNMHRASQPINVRRASSVYQIPALVTTVSTEKSVPTESTTSPPISTTDSAVEIQTPEPPQSNKLLPVYTDNRPQDTRPFYINKPALSPWSPPKFASIPSVASSMERASQPIDVRPASSMYQTPAPVTPVSTEKSATESTIMLQITSTDSAGEVQTLKPPQSNKLLPIYAENKPQDTSSYFNKPASSPWSPPNFNTVELSNQMALQSINMRAASYIYQTPTAVTHVLKEKPIYKESTTFLPINFTDSSEEIQTPTQPEPNTQRLINADNGHQNTSYLPKPASNSWNPPSILKTSQPRPQPGYRRATYGYLYQISTVDDPVLNEIPSAQNVPAVHNKDRKKFSVDPINADNERTESTLDYIPRPASSPWMPRKSSSAAEIPRVSQPDTSQPMYLGKKRHMESGPYHRPQRSANPWDPQTSDSFVEDRISQNDTLQSTETTDSPVRKLLRFICPQPHGYFKYTDQCGEYIECKNHIPLAYACPVGLHFNPQVEWTEYPCDHPSKVQCNKEPSLSTTKTPQTAPTPSAKEVTTWHPSTRPPDYTTCPQQHGYFKFNDHCGVYIECKNHVPLMFECPVGLHFNPLAQWIEYPCDYPSNVKCDYEKTPRPTTEPATIPPPPPTTTSPPPPTTTQPPPPPPTTRRPLPPPNTRRPLPPPTTRRPSPPPTTRRPLPPPTTRRPPPPPTTRRPLPPPTTRRPLPPPTTRRPLPPPSTWRPPPPPLTTRRPLPPPSTWRPPPPPPTTRTPLPPPTTNRPLPPPTTRRPLPPPTTRRPLPPLTTRRPSPPPPTTSRPTPSPLPITTLPAVITQGPKNPPDYNICLQPYGYFKFNDKCGEYIECKNYVPLVFACPVGLHFNPLADWIGYPCDHPSKVQCDGEPVIPEIQSTTRPPTVSTTVSPVVTTPHPGGKLQDFKCPQAHGYFKHNDKCSEYIECKNHIPLTYTCPDGLHFDVYVHWTQYPCADPANVQCNKEPDTKQPTENPNITIRPDVETQEPTATPHSILVTPESTVVTPRWTMVTPRPTVVTPRWTMVTPRPTAVTPRPTVVTPRPTVVTLSPTVVTQQPMVVTRQPTSATSYIPHFSTQGALRPTTERDSHELADFYCPKPNSYYSVASECDTYVECKSFKAIQHYCPSGLHFNPKAEWPNPPCDYPSKVQCKTEHFIDPHIATRPIRETPRPTIVTHRPNVVTHRPTVTHVHDITRLPRQPTSTVSPPPSKQYFDYSCPESNGFYSVASKCDFYVECKNDTAVEHSCPDGLHFNPNAKWPDYPCSYPSEVKCSDGDIVQPAHPTDECPHLEGFFPTNNGDCGEYIVCHAGVAIIHHCPAGLVFDFEKDTCDWPINVPKCNQPKALEGFVCPAQPTDKEGPIQKYRHGRSCKDFIACQEGQPRLLSCDAELRFDEKTESCVDSALVVDCEA